MTKIMLIDATHPEETRVAVVDGRRLEEFDVEVASRHPLKGNIYLAKVTRVEPSLQAAFVEYGGNRHGFLAFSEIHPDYYRIPVADREALLREEFEEAEAEDAESSDDGSAPTRDDSGQMVESVPAGTASQDDTASQIESTGQTDASSENSPAVEATSAETTPADATSAAPADDNRGDAGNPAVTQEAAPQETSGADEAPQPQAVPPIVMPLAAPNESLQSEPVADNGAVVSDGNNANDDPSATTTFDAEIPTSGHGDLVEVTQPPETIDTVGGEAPAPQEDDEEEEDDDSDRRRRQRHARRYKIQEVIKRRQILLVQVTKEERGNKGAALTTYLSLAGRYCVLMPNTDRGGGISRRITSAADRKRLKSIVDELDPPEGMAVIVRTAGMERQRSEIKRDFEYLLRLWDEIRDTTLRSSAPSLIYEEASLIKRSIRDLYTRDIGDIVVAGAEAYKSARSFMRMLAPAHAKRVQFYRDPSLPLFQRYQIESQIAAIHHPVVTLRSGGYIVINQTEALVAVDVNSGRSTRERNIEETATRTNLEAAEEVARQLRLRDLAGLIVIDFIDMDESRNNAAVERKIKEALRNDRARIQIGRISSFGLLEMSRQRLHASLQEASTEVCPHCHGTGRMRSVDSTALHVLRMVEEEITRNPSPGVTVHVPTSVALFILNQKRHALAQLELRRGVRIYLSADDELMPPDFRLERLKQLAPGEELPAAAQPQVIDVEFDEAEEDDLTYEEVEDEVLVTDSETTEDDEAGGDENAERGRGRGRGRGRRRGKGRGSRFQADDFTERSSASDSAEDDAEARQPTDNAGNEPRPGLDTAQRESEPNDSDDDSDATGNVEGGADSANADSDETRRRRRRGRRGGRRRSRRPQDEAASDGEATASGDRNDVNGEAGGTASSAGSGDQPEVPRDADALPPQWRADQRPSSDRDDATGGRTAQGTGPDGTGPDSTGPDSTGPDSTGPDEKPRRTRRPRRPREDDTTHNAPHTAQAQSGSPERAPTERAPTERAPAEHVSTERAPAAASTVSPAIVATSSGESADDSQEPKKRGWWRRLIE